MSKTSEIYNLVMMQQGDILHPYFDERNMTTVDHELAGLYSYVGPGVLSGWDVTVMSPTGDDDFDAQIASEKAELLAAYVDDPDSFKGRQLQRMSMGPLVDCRAATTSNITLSGTQTIDGVALAAEDIVLVKDQTIKSQNGVYVVKSGAWQRHSQFNVSDEFIPNLSVRVTEGNTHEETLWSFIAPEGDFTLDDSDITWIDPWTQVVRITAGTGIVGKYPAKTEQTFYFRFTVANVYYVFAEASAALATEGYAVISAPVPPQDDYDTRHTATYLATATVVPITSGSPVVFVKEVEYEDRRNQLENLTGALQAALRKGFYRHVHLGGPDNPSKIDLSVNLTLEATGPVGTTIFIIQDPQGKLAGKTLADFGFAQVRLNNQILPESAYRLDFGAKRIYLKNSLPTAATLQLVLPLSPQVKLSYRDGDIHLINPNTGDTYPIHLTDGEIRYDIPVGWRGVSGPCGSTQGYRD